jgi:hypothetical protein
LLVELYTLRVLNGDRYTSTEVIRCIRFGLIEDPSNEAAEEELNRRKNKQVAEKYRATIAHKKREAEKVVDLATRGARGQQE